MKEAIFKIKQYINLIEFESSKDYPNIYEIEHAFQSIRDIADKHKGIV
jgi:hypothetical protein